MADQLSTITQQDVDTLLDQLKALREQIATARATITPLEANLKQSYDEFQLVVGAIRRQYMRTQAEIANLRARIASLSELDEEIDIDIRDPGFAPEQPDDRPKEQDPEAIEKDQLFEHLLRVLDPMDDADLFATLQTLCQDPTVSLADVLEQSPWDLVWQARPPQEELAIQHRRLLSWKTALSKQLKALTLVEERLRNHPHYPLWQQRQKGNDAWQQFLQQAVDQQEDQNHELEAELASLRQEWEQLRGALT